MRLAPALVPDWPKLAWVAVFQNGADVIDVYHGSHVELGEGWLVEAVWAGEFTHADFDRTDLIFGTGIRCRGDRAVFVTAGSMLDRLWHCEHAGLFYVANSLPALLCCAKLSLREDYPCYTEDVTTMREGLRKYKRTIPSDSCDIHVAYYNNLLYDGGSIREIAKPMTVPDFKCYADYHGFLIDTAGRLGANLESPARRHRIVPLASISSGYDSGAAAAISRAAGCRDAVTITNASSLMPRSDSGLKIGRHLGMNCRACRHTASAYRHEETVWAIAGRPAGLNLTIFEYPGPLCLFFTGYRGDSTWCRAVVDRSEPFATPSISGLALCEFRLIQGLFHCVVPFWGSRHAEQIQAINFLDEMEPWTLHGDYDRPIPRRILEEAGVPRGIFGVRKEVTSAESFFIWPFSPRCMASFGRFLRSRGLYAPSPHTVQVLRKLVHLDHLIYVNLTHKLGWHTKGLRFLFKFKGQSLLFQWANHELKKTYERPFRAMPAPSGSAGRSGPPRR